MFDLRFKSPFRMLLAGPAGNIKYTQSIVVICSGGLKGVVRKPIGFQEKMESFKIGCVITIFNVNKFDLKLSNLSGGHFEF